MAVQAAIFLERKHLLQNHYLKHRRLRLPPSPTCLVNLKSSASLAKPRCDTYFHCLGRGRLKSLKIPVSINLPPVSHSSYLLICPHLRACMTAGSTRPYSIKESSGASRLLYPAISLLIHFAFVVMAGVRNSNQYPSCGLVWEGEKEIITALSIVSERAPILIRRLICGEVFI